MSDIHLVSTDPQLTICGLPVTQTTSTSPWHDAVSCQICLTVIGVARRVPPALPPPDGWTDCTDDQDLPAKTPYWVTDRSGVTATAWTEGVELGDSGLHEDLDGLEGDALKILAAVAASRRFKAERERQGS